MFLSRIIAFVLSFTLLSGSTGISVYKHYCGDYLADISFFFEASPCFDTTGEEESCHAKKKMSCCEDEHEVYQLDIELQKHQVQSLDFKLDFAFISHTETVQIHKSSTDELICLTDRGPPLISKVPFYIQNHRLTLYA